MKKRFVVCLASLVAGLAGLGCKGSGDAASGGEVTLTGAGSTFVNPLFAKWISEYKSVDKGAKINYQSVGSGAGVKNITDKTVDFGASDATLSDAEVAAAKPPLVHIPTTLGAVAVTYNVAGAPDHLMLTPDVLAGIFMGDIKSWNDPKLAELNPNAKLPDQPIGVAYRSDGSGTTAVFTSYLAAVSPGWSSKVGTGKDVHWLTGTGAKGNDGVANQVLKTPGAIGYVELAYALQTKQPVASLKNHSGKFVVPALDAITAAGASAKMPDDLRMSIVDAEGDGVYPISAFTYALVYSEMPDKAKATALANFLWWGIHDGQKLGAPLNFAPLPAAVVAKAEAKLKGLTSGGQPVLSGK